MSIHEHTNQDVLDLITSEPGSVNAESVCKGWVTFDGTGAIAIADSFNVSSLTDNGTGDYDVNWDIDFDNTDYSVSVNSAAAIGFSNGPSNTVGAAKVQSRDASGTLTDNSYITAQAFGDMANLSVGGSAPGVKADSLCKGWVNFDGTSTITIRDSFNVLSLTDNGTGDYSVNWDVDFDNINYSSNATSGTDETAVLTPTVGSQRINTANSSGTLTDTALVMVQAFGDNPIALSVEAGFNFGDTAVLTDAATVTPVVTANVNLFTLLTTQNFTLNTPTGVPVGKTYKADIVVTQDAGGTNTLTLAAAWLVDSGTAPVLTTDGDAVDWLTIMYDGTDWFIGLAMGDAS